MQRIGCSLACRPPRRPCKPRRAIIPWPRRLLPGASRRPPLPHHTVRCSVKHPSAFFACLFIAAALAWRPLRRSRSARPIRSAKIKAAKSITVAFSGDSLPFSYVESQQPARRLLDRPVQARHRGYRPRRRRCRTSRSTGSSTPCPTASPWSPAARPTSNARTPRTSQSRMKDVDFSNLIFVDGGGFLVRSDSHDQRLRRSRRQVGRGHRRHDHREASERRC